MKTIEVHEAYKTFSGFGFTHMSTNETPPVNYWTANGRYVASVFELDNREFYVYYNPNLMQEEVEQLKQDWLRRFK